MPPQQPVNPNNRPVGVAPPGGAGAAFQDFLAGAGGLADEFRDERRFDDIEGRANFQDQSFNVGGVQGNIAGDETNAQFTGQDQLIQQGLGQQGLNQFQNPNQTGFNTGGLNQFLGSGLNIGQQFNQTAGLLNQQQQSQAFGGLGGVFGQANQLGNQFVNQTQQGPQDLTNGAQGALFQQGFQNFQQAGNAQGLGNQFLEAQRAQASGGLLDQAINRFQDRQFAQGRLGSTGGSIEQQGFLDSLARQDQGFQTNAFGLAQQEAGRLGQLGGQQIGLGSQLFGQNLGQFNQNAQFAQGFLGQQAGFEGQQFGQNFQALQGNQSAGLSRFNAAQGLLGLGSDIFGSSQSRGLDALGLQSDRQGQLNDFSLGLRNSEADRIQAAGASSQAAGAGAGGGGGAGLGGLLGVAGTAIGGPVGGAIGSFIGGLF